MPENEKVEETVEVVTLKKDDYELLKNCVRYYKEKFEMSELEIEELKKQLTPQSLDIDIEEMRDSFSSLETFEQTYGTNVFQEVGAD